VATFLTLTARLSTATNDSSSAHELAKMNANRKPSITILTSNVTRRFERESAKGAVMVIEILEECQIQVYAHRNGHDLKFLRTLGPNRYLVRDVFDHNGFDLVGVGVVRLPKDDSWRAVRVTPEEFVVAWTKASAVEDVASALKHPIKRVLTWARRCKREGVRLKNLPFRYKVYERLYPPVN
jgi:hypothetical protein